jgi:hypothetical protein
MRDDDELWISNYVAKVRLKTDYKEKIIASL